NFSAVSPASSHFLRRFQGPLHGLEVARLPVKHGQVSVDEAQRWPLVEAKASLLGLAKRSDGVLVSAALAVDDSQVVADDRLVGGRADHFRDVKGRLEALNGLLELKRAQGHVPARCMQVEGDL